jgi:hypothetical protein
VRGSNGGSTHPNSLQFAQLVRLLSLYSLIKPPRGSNVPGAEYVESLLKIKDSVGKRSAAERKESLSSKLDSILDTEINVDGIPEVLNDHEYTEEDVDKFALGYLSGYVSRRCANKFISKTCDACYQALVTSESTDYTTLIELKTKGYLLHPSLELFQLLNSLEQTILKVAAVTEFCTDYLFKVVEEVEVRGISGHVGCTGVDGHQRILTKQIINFYLISRMHFISRGICARNVANKRLTKKAHLT